MSSLWIAIVFAIFMWWFCTGLVLLLDTLPRTTFRWSLLISSALSVAALVGLAHTAQQTSLAGAYCAFTCALLVWGWHELTFLTGWITGPRTTALPASVTGWPRFRESVRAILWHELAIIAVGVVIIAITWKAPNQVGTGTFVLLWVMRVSAKLNLFLGVRNLSEEFLPPHLAYMASFFRRRRMNALLPWSVLGGAVAVAVLVNTATAPGVAPAAAVGSTLVATLLGLAVLEHLLLVLPIPATALWRWAMRDDAAHPAAPPAAKLPRSLPTATDNPLLPAR
jgi:putative photosynthetic complex assembly protein 2